MPRDLPAGNYVYLHRKATDGTVFYVGKGKNRRAWRRDNRNKHWHHIVAKHGFTVQIVKENMSHHCAMTLERIIIGRYGVKNLSNITLGGDGCIGSERSPEQREKIAVSLGRPVWNDAGEFFASRKHAARAMQKRGYPTASHAGIYSVTSGKSATIYGHTWSHDAIPDAPKYAGIDAMIEARAVAIRCVETGEIFRTASDAARWLGRIKSRSRITACCRGKQKTAYGYTWQYAEREAQ